MCISTIDIQIDLFCQQLAATSQQTSLVEETTPAALAISDTNVQAQQVSAVKFVGSFPYPKIWEWLWKLCLKNMVFDVSFFFWKKNVWVGAYRDEHKGRIQESTHLP